MHLDLTPKQVERFWSNVIRRGPDDCWEWRGICNRDGYGRFSANNKMFLAHRVALFIRGADIPIGFVCMHTCDNPSCVNPRHVIPASPKENTRDMFAKGRDAHSKRTARPQTKLSEDQVRAIRAQYRRGKHGYGIEALASKFHTAPSNVEAIIKMRTWKHLE